MATSSSIIFVLSAVLCVYVSEIKGRPNNLGDAITASYEDGVEEGELFKRSKISSGGEKHAQGKGHSYSKEKKKQVIDAYHLGPYHHGNPWGTVSQWPGFHWGGHPSRHAGWTGYPSVGGWHKSHIPRKEKNDSSKKSGASQDHSAKRHWLRRLAFPSYGYAYPTLGFAAVPFTPTPVPWGYGAYRSDIPEEERNVHSRSSVKNHKASKRWWPGYMGGWGGWGIGNGGYPGWGPLGSLGHGYGYGGYGHGYGYGGFGHGYGYGAYRHGWGLGHGAHPFFRDDIPGKSSKKDKANKRWWPGYMGGWGGWGWGNTGYPGWGPLGGDLGQAWGPFTGDFGPGWGGFGHGFGYGWGPGYGYRSDVPNTKGDDEETAPKRQFINGGFGSDGYPYGPGFGYGFGFDGYGYGGPGFNDFPFPDVDFPFYGRGQYIPYPEAIYGPYFAGPLGNGFGGWRGYGQGFFKSKIPSEKAKKNKKKEEAATSRHFVYGYHPGRYGWGGVNYPGHGYHSVLPLLGAHTYGLFGGYYGPHGPFHGSFGPYHRSHVPSATEDSSAEDRQVINYNPGCYGWGGCIYPGCGFLGGWTWPLPCHRFCGCGGPCWRRGGPLKKQGEKEEKGNSRQEIESPEEAEQGRPDDPQTRPHLEGSELLSSQMERLAMGFPGIESLQTPLGAANPQTQGFSGPEVEGNGENPGPEPVESPENFHGMAGFTPDDAGNGFRTTGLPGMEPEGQQPSTSDLLSNFNMNPADGSPASFNDQGNPTMDPSMLEGTTSESASRRTDIPGEEDNVLTKKQAVAYPYHYYYPGYMMAHGVNPYYHYAAAAAAQHLMAYPTAYQYANGLVQHVAEEPRHSHSIHVGAPNVNVDVQTTREHVAQNPEKKKGGKLKEIMGEFAKKLKFKEEKSHSSDGKKVTKRQISPLLSSAVNRPMGFMPYSRFPGANVGGFPGGSLYPSMQPMQPFDINAMSRSRLPVMSSSAIGPTALGLSGFRTPQMGSPLSPAQLAFSRQLSSLTGISVPISTQPGMGIVGMNSRKRRSPAKNSSKKNKNKKSTKRQFLATAPTPIQAAFPALAFPFTGPALPAFPTLPVAHMQPIAFRTAGAYPAFPTRFAAPVLAPMALHAAPVAQIPGILPFTGMPPLVRAPFAGITQLQTGGMSRGATMRGGFPQMQTSEGGQGQMLEEMQQREEPVQMNGDEMASFNPASSAITRQQSAPMLAGGGASFESTLGMAPQREIASFFQGPGEGGIMESPSFGMQPGLVAARKKSSVPIKKGNKAKDPPKSRREMAT